MPFTPFHLGPALLFGIVLFRWLDFPTFLAANVIVDIRAALVFFGYLDGRLHGPLHTFVFGTMLALMLSASVYSVKPFLNRILAPFQLEQARAWRNVVAAAIAGVYLHIVLDSMLYIVKVIDGRTFVRRTRRQDMTKWGKKIPNISLDELQEKLVEVDDDGKAVKRLFTAIAYKHGHSPDEIEQLYGISRKTIYIWFDRIENRGLDAALYDEPKPGREPKLTDDQFTELEAALHESPEFAGYDDIQVWTPTFVQHWLKHRFDVEYTRRHVQRLMNDVGLSWRTARPEHYEADPEEIAGFQGTFKKSEEI